MFGGSNCGRLQEQCTGIDCLNGGRCITNGTTVRCLCAQGYQGDNCELIIDSCRSQPVRKKEVVIDEKYVFCFSNLSVKMVVCARTLN